MATSGMRGGGRTAGVLVMIGAAFAISLNTMAVTQVYAHGGNPQTVVLLRYGFFIAAFLVVARLLGKPLAFARRHMGHAMLSGTMAAAGSLGLLGAFTFIPVSQTIVLVYTYPILTALMLAGAARRPPGAVMLLCLLLALLGVALIIGIDRVVLDPRGLALAGLAAGGFAGAIAWNAVALRDADPVITSFYMSLSGIAVVAVFVLATGSYVPPSGSAFGWVALLASSAAFSLAFLGMYMGVSMLGGTPAAMLLNLEPVFTVAMAALFLGEMLGMRQLAGGALVIGTVVASQALEWRQAAAARA